MSISLPQFAQNLDCQLCDLWGGSTHVGIPARRVGSGPLKETAILAVGERPGAEEDRLNATLVGKAGLWFDKIYLRATKLNTLADVYVTNAVRCKPPKDATITKSQFKACKGYLIADLQELQKHYKTVLILGLGAGAARTLRDSSLEDAYYHQGDKVTVGDHQYVTFWTTNPANLFADRNPSMATAVADHLEMVRDFLTHGRVPLIDDISAYTVERAPSDPGKTDLLSLDIESYGAVKGLPNQTVFQATRAMVTDKCPRDQLVQTVAIAWRDDGRTRIATWNVQRDTEAHAFSVFMRTYYQRGGRAILGMNTQFDIGFLRAWNLLGGWKKERYDLLDLGIINYLHSEVRPERSLKNLSLILRSADYSDELNLKAGERYESADDPKLHLYNAKDALATLVNYDRLSFAIRRDYPDSPKLSPYCLDWYNRLLWFAVEASESGVTFDREQLIKTDRHMTVRAARIVKIISALGGTIEGEGANKWKKSFVEAALVEAGLVGDRRVHRTPKTKAVSFGEENLNLLLGCLKPSSDSARIIRLWQRFITTRDICGRYTRPLLLGRKRTKSSPYNRKSIVLESGQAHPTWYVVPSLFENQSGGTKQGRITCLNPGLLNLAKPVKKCLSTRFAPGILLEADLSQIELRTGALLSGDTAMLSYYQQRIDYHSETGKLVLRELLGYMVEQNLQTAFGIDREWIETGFRDGLFVKSNKQFEVWRFLGKTLNFLVLFKGGAKKAQETACRDLGVLLPIEVWQRIIAAFDERHPTFRAWQSEWLTKTIKTGYAMLPLIGQSRLFAGGRSAGENVINEIANFPIQTQAANTLIDGAWQARLDFQREGLKACIGLYIYDAVYVEAPAEEEARVTEILKDRLVNVDYWNRLSGHVGHTCPIEVDVKVIRRTNG